MSQCSFLSNQDIEIECFDECAFKNWAENDGICPFKCLTESRTNKRKSIYEYDIFEEGFFEELMYK